MLNLYWKSGGQTRSLVEQPFKSEVELDQYNLNKYYTGFKLGNKVVFNVAWGGAYAWKLRFKITEDDAKAFKGEHWEFQNYDPTFREATFRPLHPSSPDVTELEPLFVQAYERVAGVK